MTQFTHAQISAIYEAIKSQWIKDYGKLDKQAAPNIDFYFIRGFITEAIERYNKINQS